MFGALGGVSGAVGGGVGVLAGSQSGGLSGFAGTMAGTGAGTGAGIGFGWAAFGQDPTWQSAGIAFASAFAGAIASTALSAGWSEITEGETGGRAMEMEREVDRLVRERLGAFREKNSSAAGKALGSGQSSELLEFDKQTLNYKLSATGKALFQPIFDRWGVLVHRSLHG
jgi:hypothetical protein